MFRRLAVVKRIASSTERESKQRSRRPILKCDALWEYPQRWFSSLISNDLNRNRETEPVSRVASEYQVFRAEIILNRRSGNRDRTYESVVPPCFPRFPPGLRTLIAVLLPRNERFGPFRFVLRERWIQRTIEIGRASCRERVLQVV